MIRARARGLERGPEESERTVGSVERFLRSGWGQELTGGVSAARAVECLDLRAEYAEWRRRAGCGSCGNRKCEHFGGGHYSAMERGPECPGRAGRGRRR